MFSNFSLPETVQTNFSFENDDEVFFWNCPKNQNKLVEFCYTKTVENQKNTIRFVFDRKLQQQKYGNIHNLFYKEIADNTDLLFCYKFFPLIKKFVPKAYISTKITDDKAEVQELFSKAENLRLQDLDKMLQNFFEESLNSDFSATVKFCANQNGTFFFPSDWIENLVNDLWFLNANFIKSYGIISAINRENFLKKNSELRKAEKASKKNEALKKKFNDDLNKVIAERKAMASQIFDTRSKIIVKSGIFSEKKITPKKSVAFDGKDAYEDLRNKIIISIDYRFVLNDKVRSDMHELLEKDINENKLLKEKVAFQLKETGFDTTNLENILKENENLKIDNEFLKNKLKSEMAKDDAFITQNTEKSKNQIETISLPYDDSIIEENAILKQKIEKLENIIKNKNEEISNLKHRIQMLENRNSNLQSDGAAYLLCVPCSKTELFTDEIEDYLYDCLYQKINDDEKSLPQNKETEVSRKRDIIETILKEKKYDSATSETYQKLERIEKILKSTNRPALEELEHEGFIKIGNTKNHPKVYFYDKRYQVTFSLSPSDEKVALNKMKEIKGRFFLV